MQKIPRSENDIVNRSVSRNDHFRVLQKNVARQEGVDKVTGASIYADDIQTEDHLYGKTIRSTVAHGILTDVRFKDGIPWEEFTIVRAKDIPGQNVVTLMEPDQPYLCGHEIMHKAEPVVLIAHPDPYLVEKAVHFVELQIDPLPAAFTVEEAEHGDVQLQNGNLMKTYHVGLDNIDDSVWAGCDVVVEDTYRTGAAEQLYIEPNAMIAQTSFNDDGELRAIEVWGSLQCPFYVQKALSVLFALPEESVRVVQAETGGGFGGKEEYPNMIAGHAALLSWKAGGKPVRLIYDRQEDMWATTKRHPSRTWIKAGFKSDGTLHALDVRFDLNAGAYQTLTTVVLSRGILHVTGPYRCAKTRARAFGWRTNSIPFGAFRGFGAPQAIFAMEQHMSRCAHELGMDPAELRRKNLFQHNDTTPTGALIEEKIDLQLMLDTALDKFAYAEKKAAAEQFNMGQIQSGGPLRRGVGLSIYYHGCGFTGEGETRMSPSLGLQLNEQGHVAVLAGSVEYGQGVNTTLSQIASEILGIPLEWVHKHQPDTAHVPDSGPTVASRTTMVVGRMVAQASEALLKTLQSDFGLPLNHSSSDFVTAAERYVSQHQKPLTITVHYEKPRDSDWDETRYTGTAYSAYAWKCDVVAVEIDLTDYFTKCTDFVSVVEAGRVLNPALAAGQIEGGNAQALGFALFENTVLSEGEMKNNQFTNYIIPTTADTPDMTVAFIEFPYHNDGAFSAKGLGELPIDGPAPAIAAAVAHALGGRFINDLPLLPERIMRCVESNQQMPLTV